MPLWPDSTPEETERKHSESIYRFRQPAQEWYVARKEERLVREILADGSGKNHKNILVTGRTGLGKSSFLTWLSREALEQGSLVINISPTSDRLSDFLSLFAQHALNQVETLDLGTPRLKGIPKLDIDALLNRILAKTKKRLVIVVDQVERLFPYAANIAATAVWRTLVDTFTAFFREPRIVWVFAVKEWYFLSLFPSELDLRLINFTYVSLGDLDPEQARSLVERLASLTNTSIDKLALDLFVTKAGGRPLTLVLAFLVALERSPRTRTLEYDYLAATEPWNEIFEAEYSCLESHRQRLIVLALAHARRELVPQEEVFRKVSQADQCSRSDVEADLRRIDHDVGLVVTNEGFVAFVHSGFGIYIDSKHGNEYPPVWGKGGPPDFDDKQRRDLEAVSSDVAQRVVATVAHKLRTQFAAMDGMPERLKDALQRGDTEDANKLIEIMSQVNRSVWRTLSRTKDAFTPFRIEAGEFTILGNAIAAAAKGISSDQVVFQFIGMDTIAQVRVVGSTEIIESVFANAASFSTVKSGAVRISVTVELEEESKLVVCHVEDDGPGIPQTQKERIFEAFSSSRPGGRGGTGLGLTFVRRAVQACGGMIAEIGSPQSGAHFLLKFVLVKGRLIGPL